MPVALPRVEPFSVDSFRMRRSQIFVSSAVLGAGGALLALNGISWVFALALTIVSYLIARSLGSGKFGAIILCATFAALFCLAQNRLDRLFPARDDLSRLTAHFVSFRGTVLTSKFKDSVDGRSYTLEVACQKLLRPYSKNLVGRALVHVGPFAPGAFAAPAWGESYLFSGRLMHPRVKLFSFEFDETRWLTLKDIYCQVSCKADGIKVAAAPTKSDWATEQGQKLSSIFVSLSSAVRERVVGGHCLALGDERGRLLASMVLGDRAVSLSDSLKTSFNRVGLSHLLAASGLNLTIIVGAALFILAGFRKQQNKSQISPLANIGQNLGALVCVLFFVSLAGTSPSVTRATIMCLLLLWSSLLFRRLATGTALAAALLVSLVLDPLSILDIGLELSYGATFGIIYLVPMFNQALPRLFHQKPLSWFAGLTVVVIAAQLAVLPVQTACFQKISTLVLPANIMAEPLVAPITVAGFISSLLFAVGLGPPANLIDQGCGFLIDALVFGTVYLGSLPVSNLYLAAPQPIEVVAYFLMLFLALLRGFDRPGQGAIMSLAAGLTFTSLAFLNSSFVEILSTPDATVIAGPWQQGWELAGHLDLSQSPSPLTPCPERRGYLAAYTRDFKEAYLRSLTARGWPSPELAEGRDKGAEMAYFADWPAQAVVTEEAQGVRYRRFKTWGWLQAKLFGKGKPRN